MRAWCSRFLLDFELSKRSKAGNHFAKACFVPSADYNFRLYKKKKKKKRLYRAAIANTVYENNKLHDLYLR